MFLQDLPISFFGVLDIKSLYEVFARQIYGLITHNMFYFIFIIFLWSIEISKFGLFQFLTVFLLLSCLDT